MIFQTDKNIPASYNPGTMCNLFAGLRVYELHTGIALKTWEDVKPLVDKLYKAGAVDDGSKEPTDRNWVKNWLLFFSTLGLSALYVGTDQQNYKGSYGLYTKEKWTWKDHMHFILRSPVYYDAMDGTSNTLKKGKLAATTYIYLETKK